MRAVVYHGPGDFRVERVADPTLREPADALVRVTRTSICGSDLHLYHGPELPFRGFAVGHEGLGLVEETGPAVERLRPGQRVVVSCTAGCGECAACRRGLSSACHRLAPTGNVFGFSPSLPGAQAEAVRVPFADWNCFPVPDGVSDEQALFLSDVLPTGDLGAELAGVGPGDAVVVFGCGPVGTFAWRCARLRGAGVVIAVDPDTRRLERARDAGCVAVDPARDDLDATLREHAPEGADAVIEAVGRAELLERAVALARPGGRIAAIGVTLEPVTLPFLGGLFTKSLTLRSGLVSPQRHRDHLLRWVREGRLDPSEIVTHRLPLAAAPDGYVLFDRHRDGVLKVVLET